MSRFWLQHAGRVAQAHLAATAACWDELAAATSEVYGRIAAAGSAAAAAAAAAASGPVADSQQARLQLQAQLARDLDSVIARKMTSLMAVALDAGCAEDDGAGGSALGGPIPRAGPQQLEVSSSRDMTVLSGPVAPAWVSRCPLVARRL